MNENYDKIIVNGQMAELSEADFDALVDYLCSEEMRHEDLGLEQYRNLIQLFRQHWWLAETAIATLMKTSRHLRHLRRNVRSQPEGDSYKELVDRLVTATERRSNRHDWKQDLRHPYYDKIVDELKKA